MNKNDKILAVILILFVLMTAAIFIFAKIKADKGFIKYTNSEGIAFKLLKDNIDGTTFYAIRIFENYDYFFRYSPKDVENISVEKDIYKILNRPKGTKMVYITQDLDFLSKTNTDTMLASSEFARILGTNDYGVFKLNVKSTYTTNDSAKLVPITCANVTDENAVIYIKEGENKIYSDKGCLIIQGTKEDIIRIGDRFAYYLANVVPA